MKPKFIVAAVAGRADDGILLPGDVAVHVEDGLHPFRLAGGAMVLRHAIEL